MSIKDINFTVKFPTEFIHATVDPGGIVAPSTWTVPVEIALNGYISCGSFNLIFEGKREDSLNKVHEKAIELLKTRFSQDALITVQSVA